MSNRTRRPLRRHRRVVRTLPEFPTTGPFVGRWNAYRCDDCGGYTTTIDVDAGVTPMFLACRASGDDRCQGLAWSLGYPDGPRPDAIPPPAWEWYRPPTPEIRRLTGLLADHVLRGGLVLRKIEAAS